MNLRDSEMNIETSGSLMKTSETSDSIWDVIEYSKRAILQMTIRHGFGFTIWSSVVG